MDFKREIQAEIYKYFTSSYDWNGSVEDIDIQLTRKEFEGEYTFVVFPFLSMARKAPEVLAREVGSYLCDSLDIIDEYNVVKGFLNMKLKSRSWNSFLTGQLQNSISIQVEKPEKILVEFCSPNTNKPLHLGHIRNILLGDSMSRILKSVGHEVINTQIINDRGIAICKSMLAWIKWGEEATPESTGIKGDHFVGDYYVLFDKKLKVEYLKWQESVTAREQYEKLKQGDETAREFYSRYKNTYFNEYSSLGKEARELLKKWENGDEETVKIWEIMNSWVLKGFEETFQKLNVEFDKNYFESNTYLEGKDTVKSGKEKGIFTRHEDGSIWIDLSDVGLDDKILMRTDGTSLYITQDIGTAHLRYDDFKMDRMIYVVGNEQEYHFQVLFEILKRLGASYAEDLYHLSYGMVDLPSGKMKSREGNVVDADDLIAEIIDTVESNAAERGELDSLSEEKRAEINYNVAMGALKFFIIQVKARKRMVFDPEQSVDLQGHTGPYVQNAYVRIKSLLRKQEEKIEIVTESTFDVSKYERDLLMELGETEDKIKLAAEEYDPSYVADHAYTIAKSFHRFYHEIPILRTEDEVTKRFRLNLCMVTAQQLEHLFSLINVEMPQRM